MVVVTDSSGSSVNDKNSGGDGWRNMVVADRVLVVVGDGASCDGEVGKYWWAITIVDSCLLYLFIIKCILVVI